MIRIEAMWLSADPIDIRAGAERLLARVVQVFGAAQAHHGYPDRFGAACAARAPQLRRVDALRTSVVGLEAVCRFARTYGVEAQLKELSDAERRAQRQQIAKPLWEELGHWLRLRCWLVADGGPTAKAIDYTLGHWAVLTRHLQDGTTAIEKIHLERQINRWAIGRAKH